MHFFLYKSYTTNGLLEPKSNRWPCTLIIQVRASLKRTIQLYIVVAELTLMMTSAKVVEMLAWLLMVTDSFSGCLSPRWWDTIKCTQICWAGILDYQEKCKRLRRKAHVKFLFSFALIYYHNLRQMTTKNLIVWKTKLSYISYLRHNKGKGQVPTPIDH